MQPTPIPDTAALTALTFCLMAAFGLGVATALALYRQVLGRWGESSDDAGDAPLLGDVGSASVALLRAAARRGSGG